MTRTIVVIAFIFLAVSLALPLHFWLGLPWWLAIGCGALFVAAVASGLLFWVVIQVGIDIA